MEYSRSFALLAYVISVYYRFSAYTQIDLCTAFRTIAHFRVLIVGIFLACHSTCKIIKQKPFLSRVVNLFFRFSLACIHTLSFDFHEFDFVFFSFFLGTISKIELLEDQIEYICVSVWQIEATKCEHARFTYYTHFGSVELSSVQLNRTVLLLLCCCCAVLHGGQGFSIEWCTVWLACLVGIHGTHTLYTCVRCAHLFEK